MGVKIPPPGGEFFMPFADFLDRCHAALPGNRPQMKNL
jgi:hypothetical protein